LINQDVHRSRKPLRYSRGFILCDAFGNALGNSIVSGLSTKSNQPGQLSPQTQRELEQAEKSGQVSAELARKVVEETSRGLSVGLKGSTLKVTDGKTNWGGDLNEMTSYGNLMTARRSLLSEFDMSSNSGRALDMGFMQMQAAQMRQMTQTPIEESAAYLQGMARGEARYNHINRDRIAQQQRQVQTTRQLDTLNKQTWQADQARAKMTTLEKVQLGFDVVGMTEIPVVSQLADLGSAGISAYNGDYVGATLSMGAMIPIVGKAFEGARAARFAEKIADNQVVSTLSHQASSGVLLQTQPGVTTTILGSYPKDMASIINELGDVRSMDFGAKPGGFNVLNAPNELFVKLGPQGFWDEVNVPFLQESIIRNDNILMATKPAFDNFHKGQSVLTRINNGKVELSGFGKEYLTLRKAGYQFENGVMVRK